MALTVKVDHPDFPADTELAIEGLGVFKNGEEREVTDEQEQAFVNARGMHVRQGTENDPFVSVSGTSTATLPEPPEEVDLDVQDETSEGGEE